MLKIRLRPNKLLLAKQQIQIYGEEKAREEVKAWILKNLVKEEKIVFSKNACKMQDTTVDAVMVYSLHEPEISIENLTIPELTSQGIVYGVETPVKDVLSDKDVLIEARAVKNEKGCFVCIVRYPEFEGCWILEESRDPALSLEGERPNALLDSGNK